MLLLLVVFFYTLSLLLIPLTTPLTRLYGTNNSLVNELPAPPPLLKSLAKRVRLDHGADISHPRAEPVSLCETDNPIDLFPKPRVTIKLPGQFSLKRKSHFVTSALYLPGIRTKYRNQIIILELHLPLMRNRKFLR